MALIPLTREFIRVVELGLTNLEPWHIVFGDRLRTRFEGVRKRYPSRRVVPFALRQGSDDLAAFVVGSYEVIILHDFASPGYESRRTFDSFFGWFRAAIEDMIDFE